MGLFGFSGLFGLSAWFMRMNPRWVFLIVVVVCCSGVSATGGVFEVQHKFAGQKRSLTDLKNHDSRRRERFLSAVDLPLGGDGKATGTGLYYTKIKIGSPAKDYYVHVDTGSDIFWVNCVECSQCPKKSGLGMKLSLYNPSSSAGARIVYCDQEFCTENSNGPIAGCVSGLRCEYKLAYGDGSSTAGYFVQDVIQYDRVSGNLQTTSANSSVVFGCGVEQSGNLQESGVALDGILGFGQSKTSMISQIAAAGSMTRMFAHCLDGKNGGGIFAMGHVVQPKVNTTPMVPNKPHYNVNMEGILVGGKTLRLPNGVLGDGTEKETIIDSGTTLAYLPEEIHEPLVKEIMENHGDLEVHTIEEHFQCFEYNTSLDDGFPTVTLNFADSLQLVVYPHDYLFEFQPGAYCIGWQSSGTQSQDVQEMTLLGDLVLTNKLVVYDIENQAIGWKEYDCSSTIEIQDEQSNAVYKVGAHRLTSSAQDMGSILWLLLLCAMLHTLIYSIQYN